MTVCVLGAGAIGTAVAYDLCRRDAVARVKVCDAQPVRIRALREGFAHPKLRTYEADARDLPTLEPLLNGSAVVISCVGPEHNARLAWLALSAGAHFVDLGAPPAVQHDADALAEHADARGRWVVSGAGLAPGLANLLVMRAIAGLHAPRDVRVLVGDVPAEPEPPFHFRLAYSAEKLIEDYTHPVQIVADRELTTVEPLTGVETVHLDDLGEMEAFYAGGGLDRLAERLAGQVEGFSVKTLRHPGHAEKMRFLLALGLADPTALDVRTHLTYRDVLARRLRQRLGGTYRDTVLLRVRAEGAEEARRLTLVDHFDDESGLSAMQRCTAFPVATIASLLAQGAITGSGVGAPEHVVPHDPFFADLAERGLRIETHAEPLEAEAA